MFDARVPRERVTGTRPCGYLDGCGPGSPGRAPPAHRPTGVLAEMFVVSDTITSLTTNISKNLRINGRSGSTRSTSRRRRDHRSTSTLRSPPSRARTSGAHQVPGAGSGQRPEDGRGRMRSSHYGCIPPNQAAVRWRTRHERHAERPTNKSARPQSRRSFALSGAQERCASLAPTATRKSASCNLQALGESAISG